MVIRPAYGLKLWVLCREIEVIDYQTFVFVPLVVDSNYIALIDHVSVPQLKGRLCRLQMVAWKYIQFMLSHDLKHMAVIYNLGVL